jgi:hypothetical protein
LGARLTNLQCKKIIVVKSKVVKTGYYLAESYKEGYGSKRAVLLMILMIYLISCMRVTCPAHVIFVVAIHVTMLTYAYKL